MMYQKFGDNNYISKFIKHMLRDTYIPTIPIYKPGKKVIKDLLYIYDHNIMRAIKSTSDQNENSKVDGTWFSNISSYEFGKFYPGITSNYISNISYYDSLTHQHLGDYLRALRDLDNIDLMPFYNCFCGIYSDRLRRVFDNKSGKYIIINNNTIDDSLTTLIVPIKFNQDYTIYLNCNNNIKLSAIYYDGLNIITDRKIESITPLESSWKTYSNCAFNNPINFRVDLNNTNIATSEDFNVDTNSYVYEKYLTLLIEIPKANSDNAVILEGKYSDNNLFIIDDKGELLVKTKKKIYGDAYLNASGNVVKNIQPRIFDVIPSLVNHKFNYSFAFSDRLIEYLLLNVIHHDDRISQNIQDIQEQVSSDSFDQKYAVRFNESYVKGLWDYKLQSFIYYFMMNRKYVDKHDVNGFVDKETEAIIWGDR